MYNIQLKIDGYHIVIVGGGKIAYRKYLSLNNEDITINVVSPTFIEAFEQVQDNRLTLIRRTYKEGDIEGANIVFISTNNPKVNDQIRQHATCHQLINHTGDKDQSDFYNVKTFQYQSCEISISSSGKDVKQTKAVSNKLWAMLKEESK
ncbi:bifunctional precorrin-2 dehydrogenase/sirohydrochlorin ferrochelatase [Mammaliicoccus lentus]|uniref:precorrin-2 dehydrogenase/sirohydrochlorin ferrochelatase family protein n=1 Tax=Mammaliicoccus lentus TaxID=42858 RepID=UPI001C4F7EBD|nr:NAD(P)-dependent oxidoreductase [Mammaliicoccus lentus]MBW0763153.1 bifunctional precorrin-2 dehydrogenase/sirohydrochlorin ferrochelatase [Mammaliicoccus lentus]MCR1872735.1 bifunctional precorrin-2 dehydrogenase/sirohydrochlorin ferrochelatase [Mammaliicoccus lentus]